MSNQTLATGPIGWFGKLPAAGDFLRRNLSDCFVNGWDSWLQAGMRAAAQQQGEDWQQQFLCFPVWNFLRSQPLLTDAPSATQRLWAGVLVPSVDRVGRLFPLTVAFQIPAAFFLQIGFTTIQNRLAEVEALTLIVLGNDDLPGFEQGLCRLAPLQMDKLSPPSNNMATPAELIESLGRQTLLERLTSDTLFWRAHPPLPPVLLLTPEPLQAEAFCRLVLPSPTPISSN